MHEALDANLSNTGRGPFAFILYGMPMSFTLPVRLKEMVVLHVHHRLDCITSTMLFAAIMSLVRPPLMAWDRLRAKRRHIPRAQCSQQILGLRIDR